MQSIFNFFVVISTTQDIKKYFTQKFYNKITCIYFCQ